MSHLAVRNIHTEKKEEYKKILHNTSFYQNIVFGKKKNDKQHHQEDVWDLLTTTKIGAKKKRLRTSSIWVLVRIIEMLEYNEKNKKKGTFTLFNVLLHSFVMYFYGKWHHK